MNQYVFAARNLIDKLNKTVGNPALFKFYLNTYIFSKIENVHPAVYLVSYPKCGRTWLRIMFYKFAELNGYFPREYRDKNIVEIDENMIIKLTHDKGNWVPAPRKPENMNFNKKKYQKGKIIFLIRDPRDVLVSSWYHLKYRENIYKKNVSDFIREELTGIQKVCRFYNMWYKSRNQVESFFLLTYEELHEDPENSLRRILEFTGVEPDEKVLVQAVKNSSFQKMRSMETSGNLKDPWMKPGSAAHTEYSFKVRKGKTGGYKEELGKEDIDYLNLQIKVLLHPELLRFIKLT